MRTAARPATAAACLLALSLAAPAGCDGGTTAARPSTRPTVTMTIGTKTYTLEVADDEASRERGLMERDSIPADRGMIFVFPAAAERNFWMFHTRVPLDIVYLGADGTVVSVRTMKAYDQTNVPSNGPAKFAVELNAGQAAATGVKAGDKLAVPGVSAKP